MTRSEINSHLRWAEQFLAANNIRLPEIAYWSPQTFADQAAKLVTVKQLELGWDITDFGSNDFAKTGAVLYTVRNGLASNPAVGVPYCEKYIVMLEGQRLPCHYHVFKSEDIINRAGGELSVFLWNADPQTGRLLNTPIRIMMDGIEHLFAPGEEVVIKKGNSITLAPYIAHVFGPKSGTGDIIVGEVSKVNDDHTDNFFLDKVARFADIDEDEEPYRLLCNEYETYLPIARAHSHL